MAIGFMLYGPIKETLQEAAVNQTGLQSAMLTTAPLFFAVCILGIGMTTIYGALRDAGLFGVTEEYREDYEETDKPEKEPQTYEQYVAGRLRIERVMRYGWLGRII